MKDIQSPVFIRQTWIIFIDGLGGVDGLTLLNPSVYYIVGMYGVFLGALNSPPVIPRGTSLPMGLYA